MTSSDELTDRDRHDCPRCDGELVKLWTDGDTSGPPDYLGCLDCESIFEAVLAQPQTDGW